MIYVGLLDEGVTVYRPVEVTRDPDGFFPTARQRTSRRGLALRAG